MSGTYDCPICGKATPHWHEPLDRVRDVCCALRRYGRHEDSCAITRDEWTNPLLEIACTCGLRDELDTAFTLDQKRMTAALNQCAAAEVSSPARPPLESRLAELVLKPLLVQLNWAVSHDPNPDQMTINISEFAVEAHKGLVALLAEVSSAPPPALRELIAKWRERAELSHPPLSYEEGICKGIGLCLDELEAALASSSSQEHP